VSPCIFGIIENNNLILNNAGLIISIKFNRILSGHTGGREARILF